MLNDTFTFAVDTAATGTTTDETYSRYSESSDKSTYVGATNSMAARDQLVFSRSFATASGNFAGAYHAAFKVFWDRTVPGVDTSTERTEPIIVTVDARIPLGATYEDILHALQRATSVITTGAIREGLFKALMV